MARNTLRFILVRPEEAGNVGAAARVMANFGFNDLVLVTPRMARPEEGYKWARGAEDILESATIVNRLEEAVAPCARAYAATRRRGKLRGPYLPPRRAAAAAASLAAGGGTVAWVFGPESRGLATSEVELCSARVTIPATTAHASLNLAQAVAVCAYESAQAFAEGLPATKRREATMEARDALYRHLEEALTGLGFLLPHTARSRMGVIRRILERSALTPSETRFLRGLARKLAWAGDRLRDRDDRPG